MTGALPLWAAAAPLSLLPLGFALGELVGRLTIFVASAPLRALPADAHWTERARAIASVRAAGTTHLLFLGLPFERILNAKLGGDEALLQSWPLATLCLTAYLLGASRAGRRATIAMGLPHLIGSLRRRQNVVSAVLYGSLLGVVVLGVLAAGTGTIIWPVLATIVGLGIVLSIQAGGLVRLGRVLGVTVSPTARIESLVERAVAATGVRPSAVWMMRTPLANAYANTTTRVLTVTEGLVGALDDDAVVAVLCHELGHLDEPGRVRAARLVPLAALFVPTCGTLLRPNEPWVAAVSVLGAGVVLYLLGWALSSMSRRMEERADAHAHEEDPVALARALETLYRTNMIPAVTTTRRASHPSLWDRLVSAGVTPEWPKPLPPAKKPGHLASLAVLPVFIAVILLWAGAERLTLASDSGIARSLAAGMGWESRPPP